MSISGPSERAHVLLILLSWLDWSSLGEKFGRLGESNLAESFFAVVQLSAAARAEQQQSS